MGSSFVLRTCKYRMFSVCLDPKRRRKGAVGQKHRNFLGKLCPFPKLWFPVIFAQIVIPALLPTGMRPKHETHTLVFGAGFCCFRPPLEQKPRFQLMVQIIALGSFYSGGGGQGTLDASDRSRKGQIREYGTKTQFLGGTHIKKICWPSISTLSTV